VTTHPPTSTHDTAHVPWRAAGIGLTSLAAPVSIAAVAQLPGEIAAAVELLAMLAIIGTALFGSQTLSDRAFRLLRWIRNRPEPPVLAPVPIQASSPVTAESTSTSLSSL
jgi:hypothetical protein